MQNAATPTPHNRSNSNAMLVALCIGAGLLVGAGIMAPFFIKQKNAAEQSMREAQAAAQRAEESKNQAIALEQQKSEMRENLGQAERQISSLKDDLTSRSTALDALRQSDAEKSRTVETLQADIKAKNDAMTDLDTRLKTARTEVDSATQQNSELTTRVSALRVEESLDVGPANHVDSPVGPGGRRR